MPLFSFKLIDTQLVSDFGLHDLPSEAEAQTEAIKLARSLRETRPQLIGKKYAIFVIDEDGAAVLQRPAGCRVVTGILTGTATQHRDRPYRGGRQK
jgi:hypothetical protein